MSSTEASVSASAEASAESEASGVHYVLRTSLTFGIIALTFYLAFKNQIFFDMICGLLFAHSNETKSFVLVSPLKRYWRCKVPNELCGTLYR